MTQLHVAFYKGSGQLFDRLVRISTSSDISHCELVRCAGTPGEGAAGLCLSASGRDGGVREKIISFDPGKWEFVPVPWAPFDAWERGRAHLGKPYDYRALLLSHFLGFGSHARHKWFCSELCAHALGLEAPHTYSPAILHRALGMSHAASAAAVRRSGGRRAGAARRGWL